MTTGAAPLRSALANAAWAVEDRVVWGVADALRAVVDVIRWPFERVAWALERVLIWPLRERVAEWSVPARGAALVAAVGIAAGAVALGVSLGSGGQEAARTASSSTSPTLPAAVEKPEEPAKPVLQGAAPLFVPREGVSGAESTAAPPVSEEAGGASTSRAEKAVPAGPVAMRVARRFAEAFVLYEIGEEGVRAKGVFRETATPQLARDLAARPPQLPANAIVPKARVLNVVAGPRRGRTYTVSVSLLRVGVTSELRLDLRRAPDGWSVVNVRG